MVKEDTPPAERRAFLDKLQPKKRVAGPPLRQEDLLTDIDELERELRAMMKQADYYWEEYGEEEGLGPYEQFVEPLTALFDRTAAVFDYGNFVLARTAYEKLFRILDLEDDYGGGMHVDELEGVDINEVYARYLRAVYETEPLERRPRVLFKQMRGACSRHVGARPMLNDIIRIFPRPLPDREPFLREWTAFLHRQSGRDADAWLREAIGLSEGTSGLEKLARTEGKKRPRAYLDWLAALEREGKYREVFAAAREALRDLPPKLPIRAAIADHLCAAAERLNEVEALRVGRWEAFLAKPTLVRLIDLWDVSPGEERAGLMRQAAQHVKEYLSHPPHRDVVEPGWEEDGLEWPAWVGKSVLAHAYALPVNLGQLWEGGLRNSSGLGLWDEEGENAELRRLMRVYEERLSGFSLSSGRQEALLSWCLDVAKQRVHTIVGNQYRGGYDKAAVLIAACAEVLQLRGGTEEARALLEEVRNSFPRHRSFQAELKAAIQRASFPWP